MLISEGFVSGPGVERRRLPDWQSLARAASHFSLPIYTLRSARSCAGSGRPGGADGPADRGLDTLAVAGRQTGGEAVGDARDLLPAWRACRATSMGTTC